MSVTVHCANGSPKSNRPTMCCCPGAPRNVLSINEFWGADVILRCLPCHVRLRDFIRAGIVPVPTKEHAKC